MTPDEIKRLRYYEKQYLRTQDFQDEQSYHIEMRRRHSIAHHSWGIVTGLEIQQDPTSKIWAVQPGMAVDGSGREIVVFAPERLDTSQIAAELSSQVLPAKLKIWIAYKTEKLDLPASGYRNCDGKDDFTHIQESFRLIYQNDPPIDSPEPKPFQKLSDDPNTARWPLCLGMILWNGKIDKVGTDDRHYIGAVASQLLVPDNKLLIRGKTKSSPPPSSADPTYDDIDAKLSGTLQVTKDLTVQGKVGIGTNNPGATLDVLGSFRLNGGTVLSKIQSGTTAVGGSATKNKEIIVNFPASFASVPKVMASARAQPGNNNFPDTFAVTTRSISTTQFTVNLIRVDSTSGWAQNLQLDWMAWE